MFDTSRYMEVDELRDYIIPAIVLELHNEYYTPVIHIGIDKGKGEVACFCGQHHKQGGEVWTSPLVDDEPNITCKACLRTMKKLVRENSDSPYVAIMTALEQKVIDAVFHTIKKGSSNRSTYTPSEPETLSREIESDFDPISRRLSNGVTLYAVIGGPIPPYDYGREIYTFDSNIVHSATPNEYGVCVPVCGAKPGMVYTNVTYEEAPLLTCKRCSEITRARHLGEVPKRDRSSAMRIAMIASEEAALDKFYIESFKRFHPERTVVTVGNLKTISKKFADYLHSNEYHEQRIRLLNIKRSILAIC